MNPIEDKERYTLSKIVSDTLKDYILKNNLSTGDKLPSERELVKMFDVSRVVIREALHALESTGIITIKYGEGAFVNTDDSSVVFNNLLQFWQMNENNTEDLLELRHLLEKAAVEHLIEKTDVGQLDDLELSIEKMNDSKDLEEFTKYDIEFHLGLISATNNELFVQLGSIIVQYFSNLSSEELSKSEKEKAINEHRLILMALKNKDKKEALQLLFDHFHTSKMVRHRKS